MSASSVFSVPLGSVTSATYFDASSLLLQAARVTTAMARAIRLLNVLFIVV
jgi:hypothetical protein